MLHVLCELLVPQLSRGVKSLDIKILNSPLKQYKLMISNVYYFNGVAVYVLIILHKI